MVTTRAIGACASLGVAILAAPSTTAADSITFTIGTKIDLDNAGPSVGGPTAAFEDVGANQVELTLSFPNADTALKAFGWYFNFTGSFSTLSIVQDAGPTVDEIGKSSDAFKADGDGFFDILLAFDSGGSQVFNPGNVATFTLSGTALNVHSFNDVSTPGGGNGSWQAAVHIGGFSNGYSVWQGAGGAEVLPEPAAAWAGLLLTGAVIARRRRRSQSARAPSRPTIPA